jgi:hypothetical protein
LFKRGIEDGDAPFLASGHTRILRGRGFAATRGGPLPSRVGDHAGGHPKMTDWSVINIPTQGCRRKPRKASGMIEKVGTQHPPAAGKAAAGCALICQTSHAAKAAAAINAARPARLTK